MSLHWFDRTFCFDTPEELFLVVVERLRGTPARIEDKVHPLPHPAHRHHRATA